MTQTSLVELDYTNDPMSHVYSLAYNRSTGTTGDQKGCYYIQEQLKSAGIKTSSQYFTFETAYRILVRIAYVILLTYVVLFRLLILLVFYFSIKYLFATTRHLSLVKKEESKNVLGKVSARKKTKEKRPVVILTAHHDSFSTNLPYKLQNVLFFIFRILIFPYFALTAIFSIMILTDLPLPIINILDLPQLIFISTIFEFVIVLVIFPLMYDTKKSKGAIDNASGIAVLIEISKHLKKTPLNYYDVIIVFTGSEEWGLVGSKRYCKRNKKYLQEKYDLDRSFSINVDMVGSYIGMLKEKGHHGKENKVIPINTIIDKTAQDLNVKITKHHNFIGPTTDHKSFKKFAKKTKSNFQVVCFHSDLDSKYIHSHQDTPDKCDIKVLNNAISLIYNSLKRVDTLISNNT